MSTGGQADHSGHARPDSAKGLTLHVAERGTGLPLVFLHGFPLNHTMWEGQLTGLAGRSRVIAPDLRGFGRSPVAPGVATMEQMADDVSTTLDHLGIGGPIVLVGLSMGGYVVFHYARKHGHKLCALVFCDTRSVADSPETAAGRLKTAEQVLTSGTDELAESMLPRLFAPGTAQANPGIVESTRQAIRSTSPQGVAAALRGMAQRPDMTGFLPTVSVPTLLIVGEHDAISPPEEMRRMAGAIHGAELVVIAGAGHMSPLEQPAAFNAAIEKFLGQLGRK